MAITPAKANTGNINFALVGVITIGVRKIINKGLGRTVSSIRERKKDKTVR
jgi:hypothetical protein